MQDPIGKSVQDSGAHRSEASMVFLGFQGLSGKGMRLDVAIASWRMLIGLACSIENAVLKGFMVCAHMR